MVKVLFAPLQGYTDSIYRRLHNKYFGGIDKYYAPYLRFEPNKEPKKSAITELLPENNSAIKLIPQLLGKDIDLFLFHINRLKNQGYEYVNWNLACPYPMVYNRGFGSGLLQDPELIDDILSQIIPKIEIPISIKCRLGFDDKNEIHKLIEVFNRHDLQEIIVHARTAKQMYKGNASPDYFNEVLSESKNELIYNGDIRTVDDYIRLKEMFGAEPDKIMIGRGLLQNPFLANELNGVLVSKIEKQFILHAFHEELFSDYNNKLEKSHLLRKMQTFWEYFSFNFDSQRKAYKLIKKASTIEKYTNRVDEIFN